MSRCELCECHVASKVNCMGGIGPYDAEIMIVGQAPTWAEERFNFPVAGETGMLLADLLQEAGLSREKVFITQALRCRPVDDKVTDKNIAACRKWLEAEVAIVKPKVIVLLGAPALLSVLGVKGIDTLRGRFFTIDRIGETVLAHPTIVYCMKLPSVVFRHWEEFPGVIEDFKKLGRYLRSGFQEEPLGEYPVLLTVDHVHQAFDWLSKQRRVVFDLETTTLNFHDFELAGWTNILCFSFAAVHGHAFVLPFMGQNCSLIWDHTDQDPNRAFTSVWNAVCKFFDSDVPKWAQNGMFDINFCRANKIPFNMKSFTLDSLLAHHTLQENTEHGLDYLLGCYTNMPLYSRDLKKSNPKFKTFADFKNEDLWRYAGADGDGEVRVGDVLEQMLMTEQTTTVIDGKKEVVPLMHLFNTLVMPLNHALIDMEYAGIDIDTDFIFQHQDEIEAERAMHQKTFEEELEKVRGKGNGTLNLKSTQQTGAALFNSSKPSKDPNWDGNDLWDKPWKPGFGFPILKRTTSKSAHGEKRACADVHVLEELSIQFPEHAALNALKGIRQCDKRITTYLAGADRKSGLLKFLVKSGGIVKDPILHPNYKQHTVVTGRLATSSPAIHNIPSGKNEGQEAYTKLRHIFTVPEGWHMIQIDYSQLELRVVAALCNEKGMLQAFAEGRDIHKQTASEMFKIPIEEVTTEQRKAAKDINFGIIYGKGEFSLAEDLGVSVEEAIAFLKMYFDGKPGLEKYFKESLRTLTHRSEHINNFGRKRRFYGYKYLSEELIRRYAGDNFLFRKNCEKQRREMERQTINFGVQSTGHDLLSKYGTINCHQKFLERGMQSCLILEHHDALYARSPKEELFEATLLMVECMEQPVPELGYHSFPVDVEVGPAWGKIDEELTEQVMTWVRSQRNGS